MVSENALNVYKFFNDEGSIYKKTVDGVEIDTKYSNTEFNDSPNYFGIPIEDGRDYNGDLDGGVLQIGGHLLEGGDARSSMLLS